MAPREKTRIIAHFIVDHATLRPLASTHPGWYGTGLVLYDYSSGTRDGMYESRPWVPVSFQIAWLFVDEGLNAHRWTYQTESHGWSMNPWGLGPRTNDDGSSGSVARDAQCARHSMATPTGNDFTALS